MDQDNGMDSHGSFPDRTKIILFTTASRPAASLAQSPTTWYQTPPSLTRRGPIMKVMTHLHAEKLCADIPPDSIIRHSGDSISLRKKAVHGIDLLEFVPTNITP